MKNNNTTTNGEKRFVCENWDAEVKVYRNGTYHKTLLRKVVTNGTHHINTDEWQAVKNEAVKMLKTGKIVYLGSDIILTPIMEKDLSGIYVSARTIGGLRAALEGKKAKVKHCGEVMSDDESEDLANEQKRKFVKRISVTPDTMVTCPKCGTEFRVGKAIAEN